MTNAQDRQFDELDQAQRDEKAGLELEQLKRQMAYNEATFIRDIPLSPRQKTEGLINVNLMEAEEVLQRLNEKYPIASNPQLNAAVRAVREAVSQAPELASYVAAVLTQQKNTVRSGGDLQRLMGSVEKKIREYSRRLNTVSGIGMHPKLVELGNVRARILKILEDIPDPVSRRSAQVRFRINVATGDPQIIRPQPAGPESGEHLNIKISRALNAYLPKVNGFITYLTENPDANRIDQIGYDLVEYTKIMNLVDRIEARNRK